MARQHVLAKATRVAEQFLEIARAADADFWTHATDDVIAQPRLHIALMILDMSAGTRPYATISNLELAGLMRRSDRMVQRNLIDLESAGYIERVPGVSAKSVRLGILLLRRLRQNKPTCDTEASRAQALVELTRLHENLPNA